MSKRRELEAQKQAEDRKRTITLLVIIAAIAIIVIGGAVILTNVTGKKDIAAGGTSAGRVMPAAKTAPEAGPPANAQPKERAWGAKDAPIKVVEFLDYQCPACGNFHKTIEASVIAAFAASGKVRYEVRSLNFLDRGTNESRDAAQATMCAMDQDKFWQMHNTVFGNQLITGEENTGNFTKTRLKEMAAMVQGLNASEFATCLDSDKYASQVEADMKEGTDQKVERTPTFIINGKKMEGGQTVNDFKKIFAEVAPNVTIPSFSRKVKAKSEKWRAR